jgi:homoserine/homoserine lactone efflux protein
MPDLAILLSYTAVCFAIIVVPGPTVTVIIANSLRHGARAGLANVAGTQLGLAMMIAVLTAGLSAVVAAMAVLFDILRVLGALYLIWLGIKLWRSGGRVADDNAPTPRPAGGSFVAQGLLVILSNPKALLFFGAFIPQFIDPAAGNVAFQTVLYGGIFMAVATIFDSAYAFAAGNARHLLTRTRVSVAEKLSGTFLVGGGLWLLAARR